MVDLVGEGGGGGGFGGAVARLIEDRQRVGQGRSRADLLQPGSGQPEERRSDRDGLDPIVGSGMTSLFKDKVDTVLVLK